MILSINAEKAIDKIQNQFTMTIEENFLNLIKRTQKKPHQHYI